MSLGIVEASSRFTNGLGALVVSLRRRPEAKSLAVLFVASGLAFSFLFLAGEVSEGETRLFDEAIMAAFRQAGDLSKPIGPHWLEATMIELTSLGGYTVLALITIVVATYLLIARRAWDAGLVLASIVGATVLSNLLKLGYARPRPDQVAHLVDVSSFSFPSGHALLSAVTYLTLGALVAAGEERRSLRMFVIGVAVALTLAIGVSRIYLGVHFPTDVAAGWCVGSGWALTCLTVAGVLKRPSAGGVADGSRAA